MQNVHISVAELQRRTTNMVINHESWTMFRTEGGIECYAVRSHSCVLGSFAHAPPLMHFRPCTSAHALPLMHLRSCTSAHALPLMHLRSCTSAHALPLMHLRSCTSAHAPISIKFHNFHKDIISF